jgi:hypothetical protein
VTDIFHEVEEDVRREQYMKLARRYGPYALAFVLVLLAAVGGFEAYKSHRAAVNERQAAAFADASLKIEKDPKAAAKAFAALAEEGGGYGLLSRFREAEALSATGDSKGALGVLDGISADSGVEPVIRDLARLKTGYLLLDSASRADMEARLKPLADGSSPWRYDARSLLSFAALKAGERARALEGFNALASDPGCPEGVMGRAREMVMALGGQLPEERAHAAPKNDAVGPPPATTDQAGTNKGE